MEEMVRSIGFLCSECGFPEQRQLSIFAFSGGETELCCRQCAKSRTKIVRNGERILITVPCIVCNERHTVMCSAHDFLYEPILAFSCSASGMDCCYVGKEEIVQKALRKLIDTLNAVSEEARQAASKTVLKETILFEAMLQITDRSDQGKIRCECGSDDWDLDIRGAKIHVICNTCHGRLCLSAATIDDLEEISSMDEICIPGGVNNT